MFKFKLSSNLNFRETENNAHFMEHIASLVEDFYQGQGISTLITHVGVRKSGHELH